MKTLDSRNSNEAESLIPFLMALTPSFITRTIQVQGTKGLKELVSVSFIARFSDGTEKILNNKRWQLTGLLRDCDIDYVPMNIKNCPLFWCDWSKNPIFGTFKNNYPTPLIPDEIFN